MRKNFARERFIALLPKRSFLAEDADFPSEILWDDGTPILWDDNSGIFWENFGSRIPNTNAVIPKRTFLTTLE